MFEVCSVVRLICGFCSFLTEQQLFRLVETVFLVVQLVFSFVLSFRCAEWTPCSSVSYLGQLVWVCSKCVYVQTRYLHQMFVFDDLMSQLMPSG